MQLALHRIRLYIKSTYCTVQGDNWWLGLSSNLCADSRTHLTKGLPKRGARRLCLAVLLLGAVAERFGATGIVGDSIRTRESVRLPMKSSRSWNDLCSASSLSNSSMHWKHSSAIKQLVSVNALIPFPHHWFRIADKRDLASTQASLCSSFCCFLCVALLSFMFQRCTINLLISAVRKFSGQNVLFNMNINISTATAY